MKIGKTILTVAALGTVSALASLMAMPLFTAPAMAQNPNQKSGGGNASALVVVEPVKKEIINDHLTAIGTSRADQTVAVTPWSAGTLEKFFVKAGQNVKINDPIAKLDSDNEEIALEQAKVQLEDAKQAYERIIRLRETQTVSQVQEISGKLALAKAELSVKDAQLTLERRTIRAPINGMVGILPIDAGNYVTTATTIANIDNRSKILVDIWVPERYAPSIEIGQSISAKSIARPGDKPFIGTVSAIDSKIDEASRTLRVRSEILNKNDVLRGGMSFEVSLTFPGDPYASVNPLAIQWSGSGAYVWRIKDNKAYKTPVSIIQRNSNNVLVNGEIEAGDNIVIQGVQSLREGIEVRFENPQARVGTQADNNRQEPTTKGDEEAKADHANAK
ncbi:efflux RND transporter periplasmic adaptor subunit [Bartonella sp. HY761]|uniref:efflux RND transporter periplasmic adaptor subunit n=1 Tax=Bartonella sp. HY761 TaxID=2979330 RepID=UPI00220A6DA4|nr:efflux RND transporter periplasmic adaptor subunit [Bartonella sp. HY761]UXN06479.1 efflux RND transporter periplasmic adaptor subunit [Bartonella sp. HY761]